MEMRGVLTHFTCQCEEGAAGRSNLHVAKGFKIVDVSDGEAIAASAMPPRNDVINAM